MVSSDEPQTAPRSLWETYAPVSGLVFVALFVVGSLLIAAFSYLPSAEDVQEFYRDGSSRIAAGAYISTLSSFFLLLFAGSLRRRLMSKQPGQEWISAVAFGGAVASSGIIIIGSVAMNVGAARAGTAGELGPNAAMLVYDLYGAVVGQGLPISMAALIAATAAVAFRTVVFSRWVAWASVIIAVALLTPYNWALVVLIIPWFAVLSIIMLNQERGTRAAA